MGNLEIISAWDNHLTGPLPDFLKTMTNLKGISLDLNQFSGTIPADFFENLVNLEYIYLNDNLL
jgi:hypothetical protein